MGTIVLMHPTTSTRITPQQQRRYDFIRASADALGRRRPTWSDLLDVGLDRAEAEARTDLAGAGIDAAEIMLRAIEGRRARSSGKRAERAPRPFNWSGAASPIVDE